MLRYSLFLTLTTLLFASGNTQADVYKFTDEKGEVQYTDKPKTLPAELLRLQSQKTDAAAVQARQEAETKRMQAAASSRQQTGTQQADQKAASELTAVDKAERCKKARERYDNYANSQRLYEALPNGERRYLSDAEIDTARTSSRTSMEELCK